MHGGGYVLTCSRADALCEGDLAAGGIVPTRLDGKALITAFDGCARERTIVASDDAWAIAMQIHARLVAGTLEQEHRGIVAVPVRPPDPTAAASPLLALPAVS
jgi:hypothetical protein